LADHLGGDGWATAKIKLMGKGRRGDRSTTELLPRLVEQIGVEPMADNPMSSAHQKEAGKKATVELPGVLTLHHRRMRDGTELNRHYRVHENPQSTAR
jgi:hypothetical protein